MNQDPVIVRQQTDEIAVCILNRPEKRNALSILLMQQLCRNIERILNDGKTRVLVLRGEGSVFCSGLDIAEVLDPILGVESAAMMRRCLLTLYQAPVVTLAMVQGAAIGGGAGLAASCDFVVADNDSVIGFPEVRRGLVPAQVMGVLVRRLNRADVREILLSGESIGAGRALQMGLFTRIGDVEAEANSILSQVLRGAPGAISRTKRLLDLLDSRRMEDDLEECMRWYLQAREAREAQEGNSAFLQKREPSWHSKP